MLTEFDWSGWPEGVDRVLLPRVDSTMAEAARRAHEITRPTWILAGEQTAGRARRGRAWSDPVGNFAATLIFKPAGTPEQGALRSFVAALALHDTLAKVVPPSRLSLKWPNDVLLGGGKVAGILLESAGGMHGLDWLSIGIGVNLTQAPMMSEIEPGAVPPTFVGEHSSARLTQEGVLFELARAFAHYEAQFTTYGFNPIRTKWLQHAARLGEPIVARMGNNVHKGTFETVDTQGNLVLTTSNDRLTIAAAEVFF